MPDERRRFPRVETHIVIKLVDKFTRTEHLGYIENISEGGLGVVSLDFITAGSHIIATFFLPEITHKLTPQGYVVHSRKGAELAHYYGICFRVLSKEDQHTIAGYVQSAMTRQETVS
jgi:hypothetical protein